MISRISESLRKTVAQRANFICEYCLFPEIFLATTFHIDYIRNHKHGGKTILENLAYSCPHCNQNKGSDIATFLNDENDDLVRFFNPRKETWFEHFEIDNGKILSLTPVGTATINILNFNQIERVILRKELIEIGLYPSK